MEGQEIDRRLHDLLIRAKSLYGLGRLSIELPTDKLTEIHNEAAKIINEIDDFVRDRCWCKVANN